MTKILVTGATGTVGTQVVSALGRRSDVTVRVGVRDRAKAAALGPRVEVVDFSFEDAATHAPALAGVDALFLLTPFTDTQAALGRALVEAARHAGVKKIVKLSAAGVEQEAFELARWHREVERAIEASGVRWVHLRPTYFMSNLILFYPPDAEGAIYLPTGTGRAGWIDPQDVAAVAAEALTRPDWDGHALVLTGPERLSLADLAAQLGAVTGRTIRHVDVPEAASRGALEGMKLPPWAVQAMLDLNAAIRNGWADATTTTVKDVTGRAPRTFAEFAREHAARWQR